MGENEKRWIDGTFFGQDLLPGWLWAPMDTATELPELPFRPWNTSVPICGLLNLFLYNTILYKYSYALLYDIPSVWYYAYSSKTSSKESEALCAIAAVHHRVE